MVSGQSMRYNPYQVSVDYAGVSMSTRDANSKKAAADASKLFQDYYPELLSYVSV